MRGKQQAAGKEGVEAAALELKRRERGWVLNFQKQIILKKQKIVVTGK